MSFFHKVQQTQRMLPKPGRDGWSPVQGALSPGGPTHAPLLTPQALTHIQTHTAAYTLTHTHTALTTHRRTAEAQVQVRNSLPKVLRNLLQQGEWDRLGKKTKRNSKQGAWSHLSRLPPGKEIWGNRRFGPSPVLSPLTSQLLGPSTRAASGNPPLGQREGPGARRGGDGNGPGAAPWRRDGERSWEVELFPAGASPHLKEGLDGRGGGCTHTPLSATQLTPSLFTCSPILRLPKWTWGTRAVQQPHTARRNPPA